MTSMFLPSLLSTARVARTAKGMTRGRGVIRVVQQAKRSNAMQQVIVSRNDKEEVWVETPTGTRLAECFFKAPDETPHEVEDMGYPGTHLRRDTAIPQWFQASKAAARQ